MRELLTVERLLEMQSAAEIDAWYRQPGNVYEKEVYEYTLGELEAQLVEQKDRLKELYMVQYTAATHPGTLHQGTLENMIEDTTFLRETLIPEIEAQIEAYRNGTILNSPERIEAAYLQYCKEVSGDELAPNPLAFVLVMWEWEVGETYRLTDTDVAERFLLIQGYGDKEVRMQLDELLSRRK